MADGKIRCQDVIGHDCWVFSVLIKSAASFQLILNEDTDKSDMAGGPFKCDFCDRNTKKSIKQWIA